MFSQEEHFETMSKKIRSISILDPVALKIDLGFEILTFLPIINNYTSDMGQIILFLVQYDQWNKLILVLTRYEQL